LIGGTALAGFVVAALAGCGSTSGTGTPAAGSGNAGSSLSSTPPSSMPPAAGDGSGSGSGAGAGSGSAGGQGTGTTTAAGPGRCHTSGLSANLHYLSPGAGQRYAALVLTNSSGSTCRIYGYPGLQLLDGAHHALPTTVVRDPASPAHLLTVDPGRSVFAMLHWSVIPGTGESQTGPCEPTATFLWVTPPDETTQLTLSWAGGYACEHGRFDTSAFAAGTGPAA